MIFGQNELSWIISVVLWVDTHRRVLEGVVNMGLDGGWVDSVVRPHGAAHGMPWNHLAKKDAPNFYAFNRIGWMIGIFDGSFEGYLGSL